jgi:beta-aspartyl-peptidase (threonine type)
MQTLFPLHLGGIAGKFKGRVGDAPLVGCGGYANKVGGATTTGDGESIMKVTLAREVVFNMENDQNAQVKHTSKKITDMIYSASLLICIAC